MAWDNVDKFKPESGGGFGKLQEGSNYVRIVSEPSGFYSHYNPNTKKSTICSGDGCEICKLGNKPASRFIINAFEIEVVNGKFTGKKTLKHYEVPYTIINMLMGYQLDPEYKYDSIPGWDCNIKKETGSDVKDVKYTVIPSRKDSALTDEETDQAGDFETPDEVIDKKRGFNGDAPLNRNMPQAEMENGTAKKAEKAVTAGDDEQPPLPTNDDSVNPRDENEINLDEIPF